MSCTGMHCTKLFCILGLNLAPRVCSSRESLYSRSLVQPLLFSGQLRSARRSLNQLNFQH